MDQTTNSSRAAEAEVSRLRAELDAERARHRELEDHLRRLETQARLFQAFSQADVPTTRKSGGQRPSDAERKEAAGMDDYVSKPVRTDALRAALERFRPAADPPSLET